MNDYDTIDSLSKRFTHRERVDMMLLLLRRVRDRYHLSPQDIDNIWAKSQQEPCRCTYIREDGVYKGTKCRYPVVPTTKYCKHHKELDLSQ